MKDKIDIDQTINKAVKEAIREYDKEKRMSQRDKRLHNTRLLMKNYNRLKEHVENVNDDIEKANEKIKLDFDSKDDEIWITSIIRTKLRTMKMMAYIDSALKILENKFNQDCEDYKYKAFKFHYMGNKTNEEIQEILGCGKNSPKKWSDSVMEELSLLLWGIEALGI